jgi:hypothetical protein
LMVHGNVKKDCVCTLGSVQWNRPDRTALSASVYSVLPTLPQKFSSFCLVIVKNKVK